MTYIAPLIKVAKLPRFLDDTYLVEDTKFFDDLGDLLEKAKISGRAARDAMTDPKHLENLKNIEEYITQNVTNPSSALINDYKRLLEKINKNTNSNSLLKKIWYGQKYRRQYDALAKKYSKLLDINSALNWTEVINPSHTKYDLIGLKKGVGGLQKALKGGTRQMFGDMYQIKRDLGLDKAVRALNLKNSPLTKMQQSGSEVFNALSSNRAKYREMLLPVLKKIKKGGLLGLAGLAGGGALYGAVKALKKDQGNK